MQRRTWFLRFLSLVAVSLLALPMRNVFAFTFWLTAKSMSDWPELKRRIREKFPTVPHKSVAEAVALVDKALFLDTRSAAEFAVSHLPGARHTPDLASAQAALKTRAPGQLALLYCSVGYRSAQLAASLLALGEAQLVNLEGSLFEWVNEGHALAAQKTLAHPFNKNWSGLLRRDRWSHVPT